MCVLDRRIYMCGDGKASNCTILRYYFDYPKRNNLAFCLMVIAELSYYYFGTVNNPVLDSPWFMIVFSVLI